MKQPQNIIFWGAGATAQLGIRTTDKQTKFIKCIVDDMKPLQERIREALQPNDAEPWHSAFFDLITILGDTRESYSSIHYIDEIQREAMCRSWTSGARPEELDGRIIGLRLIYDWPALKSVVKVCPGYSNDAFKLNDLFNLLDMHIPPGFGFRAPIRQNNAENQSEQQFFDARRLIGAKNALLMILIALFYIDYQECIRTKRDLLNKYHDFALMLGQRMQQMGLDLARPGELDQPDFYQGDVGFVSLNYDPILLWLQFNAHRELNGNAPQIRSSDVPLHLFHDFGHLIPARRIAKPEPDWPWYPMNEAAVQRLSMSVILASD